ncbi:hypothetical protein KLP28_08640 [Nocardioidaceae bacterium]|nr:hypothetical protein KLP28_08640 [Nocardioidaceae bacterium]
MAEDDDYELRWPRDTFRDELQSIAALAPGGVNDRVEALLVDAFTGDQPLEDFQTAARRAREVGGDPWATGHHKESSAQSAASEFVSYLLTRAESLPHPRAARPFYSQWGRGGAGGGLDAGGVAVAFRALVADLEARGYFEHHFGKDCPDEHDWRADEAIEQRLGRLVSWNADVETLLEDPDGSADPVNLFDLIEVIHDLAGFPRTRWMHGFQDCAWHHVGHSASVGRAVYRWEVNRILERSSLGLRLADDGDDQGRLVAVVDEGRADLAARMAALPGDDTGERVRHALALFRAREATRRDKVSACNALYAVLERHRALLISSLFRKDEGALFQIANDFAMRHNEERQRSDYDEAFLDWVFWWYLATVDLTERLLQRQRTAEGSDEQAQAGRENIR